MYTFGSLLKSVINCNWREIFRADFEILDVLLACKVTFSNTTDCCHGMSRYQTVVQKAMKGFA